MEFFIVLFLVVIFISVFLILFENKSTMKRIMIFAIIIASFVTGVYYTYNWCKTNIMPEVINEEPTAIEVYQGKTTLKITYIDSIAIDSSVVYKPNRNEVKLNIDTLNYE